jgi:hypothetical protein
MPKSRQVKTDFLAGEISPRAYTRIDAEFYAKACRELTNFVVVPQGGAWYRHGSQWLGDSRTAVEVAPVLATVSRGGRDDDFVLELGVGALIDFSEFPVRFLDAEKAVVTPQDMTTSTCISGRHRSSMTVRALPEAELDGFGFFLSAQTDTMTFFDSAGTQVGIVPAGSVGLFSYATVGGWTAGTTTPYSTAQTDRWDASGGTAEPAHPFTVGELPFLQWTQKNRLQVYVNEAREPQYLSFQSDWSIPLDGWNPIPSEFVPTRLFGDDKSPEAIDSEVTLSFVAGQWGGGGSNNRFRLTVKGQETDYRNFQGSAAENVTILTEMLVSTAAIREGEVTVTRVGPDSPATGDYTVVTEGFSSTVEITIQDQFGQEDPTRAFVTVVTVGQDGSEKVWSYPTVVTVGANYYQAIRPSLNEDPTTPASLFWTDLGTTEPDYFFWQYPNGNEWDAATAYGEGDRGFPRTCTFHDQRLILGGSPDAPLTIWGSKVGQYDYFLRDSVNDSDAWAYDLDSLDSPEVQWLTSNRGLAVGTTNGDFLVNAQRTITPSDVFAARYTGRRSELTRPALIGNEIFNISLGLDELRRVYYERDSDGYRNDDFSSLAEHLTSKGLLSVEKMLTPETLLYALTQQGDLVQASYDQYGTFPAFGTVQTDGFVGAISMAFLLPQDLFREDDVATGFDNLFTAVRRLGDSGSWPWQIEAMPHPGYHRDEASQHTVHSDAYVIEAYQPAAGTSDPYPHLRDKAVSGVGINASDALIEFTATASGTGVVTFPEDFKLAAFGLPFTGQIQTTEVNRGPNGVGLGTQRRWDELILRSQTPYSPEVKTTATGQYQARTDGDDEVDDLDNWATDFRFHDTGFDRGIVWVRFTRPRPLQLTGLFGSVSTNET